MKTVKPDFLRHVNIKKTDVTRLTSVMSSWAVLAHNIREIEEDDLEKMIIIELNDKCRMQIIHRLKSRLNTLRSKRENIELTSIRTT